MVITGPGTCVGACSILGLKQNCQPTPQKKCGSWLASDVGTSVIQLHRGDAIAGKPAPTLG
ncbi:hypothetical protein E3O56_00160 [Pseudomonas sp. W2Aug9]|nr:hypothetical protein [Pseudomonas sp. W2Aug9]